MKKTVKHNQAYQGGDDASMTCKICNVEEPDGTKKVILNIDTLNDY